MSRTSAYLAVGIIVALAIGAAGGYFAGTSQSSTQTMTMTETMMQSETMTASGAGMMQQDAIPFTAQAGQMMQSGWLVIAPTSNGQFALSIYLAGLEPSLGTNNNYIVQGVQMSGSMASVPVTGNATSSEFEVASDGVGSFFAILPQNPNMSFESIQIFFLPNMLLSSSVLVATASFSMASTTTSSM